MSGTLHQKIKPRDQFPVVDDEKLRMTLLGVADKYSYQIREMIARAYNDPELMLLYKGIRNSGIYQHGGKGGARHRKILEFPNAYIADFVDTVMTALYDQDWLKNNNALKHELVRPWWVVERL